MADEVVATTPVVEPTVQATEVQAAKAAEEKAAQEAAAAQAATEQTPQSLDELKAELERRDRRSKAAEARVAKLEAQVKTADEAKLSELEKAQKSATEAAAELVKLRSDLASERLVAAIEREASKQGFTDPRDGVALVDRTALVDDEGKVDEAELAKAISAVLGAKPYLKGGAAAAQATSATNGAGRANVISLKSLDGKSAEEIADLMESSPEAHKQILDALAH